MDSYDKILIEREQLEQREHGHLAAYGVSAAETRGREYPEPEHHYRTCFQRDRDRVIHSAAFRRLEAKTQVFTNVPGDYYRTRLTHTIEVAQIARTIARILSVNEDLSEAAALAHDLGHPPYGHAGEAALNKLMSEYGGFEHNRQSLRVVEYLEHPYPAYRGLNLTFEVRESLAKHATKYDQPDTDEKYGSGYAALEGQIADLADSIAYNSHDLDDALAGNLIDEADLSDVPLYQLLRRQIEREFPQAHRFARQLRCAKLLIDLLVNDALAESARRLKETSPGSAEDVRQEKIKIISLSEQRQKELSELENFLFENVYEHPRIAQVQQQAEEELSRIFDMYVNDPKLLPERYRQRIGEQELERVACDYIAGMTDRYCHELYQRSH
jgi:dGTPase